jgi:hypothetical protein
MAKISARGAGKVASASKTWTDEDGWDHKHRLALRSDGKVLGAHDIRDPKKVRDYGYTPAKAWNRGGYSIVAELRLPGVEAFRQYADHHGFTID